MMTDVLIMNTTARTCHLTGIKFMHYLNTIGPNEINIYLEELIPLVIACSRFPAHSNISCEVKRSIRFAN
jgi:uncharacterized membrane protein YcfT